MLIQNQELLLENTLHHIRLGMTLNAYERLSGYVFLFPYKENAALVGYAGLLCYLLWAEAKSTEARERYLQLALDHLKSSLLLDGQNSLFLRLHVKLLSVTSATHGLETLRQASIDYPDNTSIC